MVHQKLELNFEPRINIITGPNGSGKSAILQAIVLALGRFTLSFDLKSGALLITVGF
jgi:chromosome segregation ATPase